MELDLQYLSGQEKRNSSLNRRFYSHLLNRHCCHLFELLRINCEKSQLESNLKYAKVSVGVSF